MTMWKNILLLANKQDVLAPVIAILLGVLIAGLLTCFARTPAGRAWVCIIVGAVTFLFVASRVLRFAGRYRRLKRGRCPRPGCRGVVQRSERLGKGWVVCPTCKSTWPELSGIKFRLTVRT